MKSPLDNIKALIPVLPQKDAQLAEKFLNERNFQGILELVESDLYKARKKSSVEEESSEYEVKLMKLMVELQTYMSYLDVPDNSDEYDYY